MFSTYPTINCFLISINFIEIYLGFLIRLICAIYCNISQYLNQILQYIAISFSLAIPTPILNYTKIISKFNTISTNTFICYCITTSLWKTSLNHLFQYSLLILQIQNTKYKSFIDQNGP